MHNAMHAMAPQRIRSIAQAGNRELEAAISAMAMGYSEWLRAARAHRMGQVVQQKPAEVGEKVPNGMHASTL